MPNNTVKSFCSCDRCGRRFTNSKSLQKHRIDRHSLANTLHPKFVFASGDEVKRPEQIQLDPNVEKIGYYREWLGGITERINGAHHPKFPGRWFKIELNQTPRAFFSHILWKLDAPLHSACKMRRYRGPFISRCATKLTYRIWGINQVRDLFDEAGSEVVERALFTNWERTNEAADPALMEDPIAALEAAKNLANHPEQLGIPTSSSTMIVGEGEGRQMREFELQWWPYLYTTSAFGKLSFRFFLNKVSL